MKFISIRSNNMPMDLLSLSTDIKHNWSNHGLVISHKCCSFFHKIQQSTPLVRCNITTLDWFEMMKLTTSCGSILKWRIFTDYHSELCNQLHLYIICITSQHVVSFFSDRSGFGPTKSPMIHQYCTYSFGYTPHWSRINEEPWMFCTFNEIRITWQSTILTIRLNLTILLVKTNRIYWLIVYFNNKTWLWQHCSLT